VVQRPAPAGGLGARSTRPDAAADLARHAERTYRSFNERFWYAPGDYLYDVVDGEQGGDPACRPNQVLALSVIGFEKTWEFKRIGNETHVTHSF
jgi:glycogen debranching enzyme